MKVLQVNSCLITVVLLVLLTLGFTSNALAQTVTVSPGALSYGIPTGSTPPLVSSQYVTVTTSGSGTATLSGFAISGANSADFTINGNSCTSTQTAPAICLISVQFTSTLPAPMLETATLNFNGPGGPFNIPLSGAYGAIKLFNETNVNSDNGLTYPYTIASNTQNLACPASPAGKLSGTPDGSGYVLVDDLVTMATGAPGSALTPVNNSTPHGNVCTVGDSTGPDCFTFNYEVEGFQSPNPLLGLNPDSFANPGNGILPGDDPANGAGGVPPIEVSAFLTTPNVEQVLFTLLQPGTQDPPAYYANSTMFLVTNCTPQALVPGGSITGNPTTANTAAFDSNPNANFSITDNTTQNAPATGTVPVYTQIAVPQQLFYQLVEGTSAAPDVCFRFNSELDYSNPSGPAPMCAGVLVQCWNAAHTSLSGNNCDSSTPVGARDLYDFVKFASPDAPVNGTNFLYSEPGNACSYYTAGGVCAAGTGPAMLMGGDNWLCAPGTGTSTTCTPIEPSTSGFNTTTSPSTVVYSEANCGFNSMSGLYGDLCPLDGLIQFEGATDGGGGSSVTLKNSVFFPTANHPLPTATVAIAGQSAAGWVNSSTINATFNSYEATYTGGATNPSPNGFLAAPVYSLTYGISNYPNLPDPVTALPHDITNNNTGTNPNFGVSGGSVLPLCPSPGASPFVSQGSFSGLGDGIYNVHYYTTDCALTEGLVFNPTGSQLNDPTANWASFPFVTVGVDTVLPTLGSCTPTTSPIYNGWYNNNVNANCTVNDTYSLGQYGSGFGALVNGIQGSSSEVVSVSTSVLPGAVNSAAVTATPPSPPACDLAGNCVSGGVSAGPFMIDMQAPAITASAGTSTVGGSAITVTFTCNDGTGSGVPSGGCIVTGTPANYVSNGCTPSAGASVTCGGTIPATTAESGTLTVSGYDNVGNVAAQVQVDYAVNQEPLTITASNTNYTYGSTPPTPTPLYTYGAVNQSPTAPAGLTAPTCTTTATGTTPVGPDTGANTCSGAVGSNYSISYVAGNATVNAEPLTITASNTNYTYSNTPTTPTPLYTYGAVNQSPTAPAGLTAPTCTTTATSTTSVGPDPGANMCSGAVGSNYSITYVAGNATVNAELLTITASNTNYIYGSTPPTPTPLYTYGAVVQSPTAPAGLTAPTCKTTATSTTPVGTVVGANTCSGAVGSNYSIGYTSGNATVNAEPLTITASNTNYTYGSTPPTPTPLYTYGAVVQSPTAPAGLTAPTCKTTATSATPVGTVVGANTCSGAVGSNYSIGYAAGNATVNAEPLTITATNTSYTFGTTPPSPTPLYTYGAVVQSPTAPAGLTAPTCTTTVTNSTSVGTYVGANTCSGAVGSNYSISYVAGNATVNPAGDFTITATPSSETISSGHTATFTITVTPTGGLTGIVNLTCSGGPANSTCSITPAQDNLQGKPISSTVTLMASKNVTHGTWTLTFTGQYGSTALKHSYSVTLIVKGLN